MMTKDGSAVTYLSIAIAIYLCNCVGGIEPSIVDIFVTAFVVLCNSIAYRTTGNFD